MSKPKVFISNSVAYSILKDDLEKECDVSGYTGTALISKEEFLESIKGVDGFIFVKAVGMKKVDASVLDAAGSNLKCVSSISVGLDNIDLDECAKRNVRVGHTPNVLTDTVADLCIALILMTTRRLIESWKRAQVGDWSGIMGGDLFWLNGHSLQGMTVGVVGFGRIGQEVARRLKAFKIGDLLYTGPSRKPDLEKELNAKPLPFETLLQSSDIVIACCPLDAKTAKMFNKDVFTSMKKTSIFINIGRGGLVDQPALIEALQNGTIAYAGLDVADPEPLPADNPLNHMDNCVLLPHVASGTIETRTAMAKLSAANVLAGVFGREMPAEYRAK